MISAPRCTGGLRCIGYLYGISLPACRRKSQNPRSKLQDKIPKPKIQYPNEYSLKTPASHLRFGYFLVLEIWNFFFETCDLRFGFSYLELVI
jgi:hypothetical protein